MPKQTLTVGDIKDIEKFLDLQKEASEEKAIKEKIEELIKKLDEMEIRS